MTQTPPASPAQSSEETLSAPPPPPSDASESSQAVDRVRVDEKAGDGPPLPLEGGEEKGGEGEGEGEGESSSAQGAFDPVTGKINWDCPCLGGMAHGPCGMQFREAFSCFVFSEEEPKGIDCVEKFKAMQDCFRENPDVYGEGTHHRAALIPQLTTTFFFAYSNRNPERR
jgi:mitochondrial intermembrane space import and assembly protein 40